MCSIVLVRCGAPVYAMPPLHGRVAHLSVMRVRAVNACIVMVLSCAGFWSWLYVARLPCFSLTHELAFAHVRQCVDGLSEGTGD